MAHRPSKIKRHRRERPEATITLTSMIDIFICLLLFLLQSFSASEEVIVADKSFQLPASLSSKEPTPALTIKVNNDVLVLESDVVGETQAILQQSDLLIPVLYQGLLQKAEQSKNIAARNPSVQFRGEVIIQGDREIPFMLLKKIMYTCSRAEYGNIALAVLQREN